MYIFVIIFDFVEAVLVYSCQWALCPISTLLEMHPRRSIAWISTLSPLSLLAPAVRARLAFKIGRMDQATTLLEVVTAALEDQLSLRTKDNQALRLNAAEIIVFTELYTYLAHAYLRTAHVEDACMTVVRAHRTIGVSCLHGMSELHLRNAQIVKAGIVAGRLLDETARKTQHLNEPAVGAASRKALRQRLIAANRFGWQKAQANSDKGPKNPISENEKRTPGTGRVIRFPGTTPGKEL